MPTLAHIVSALQTVKITSPASEVALLLVILMACLTFRFHRIGIVAAYFFAYKWGWAFFRTANDQYLIAYLVFGCLTGILTVVNALRSSAPAS